MTKVYCFFRFSFFQHVRVQQYMCITVINNNNDDLGGPGFLNSFFGNQFKCITRVKLRVFVLKVATSGAHVTFFMNIMQKPGPDLPYDTVPGACAQVVRHLFGLHLYLAGRCCKNPQSSRGPHAMQIWPEQ